MTILQSGFAKSGNMLLHVILRSILELTGREYKSVISSDPEWGTRKDGHIFNSDLQPSIDVLDVDPEAKCQYIVSSFYQKPIQNIEEYASRCSIIWTHSEYYPKIFERLFNCCKLNVYMVRDPRSVLNSMAHYIETRYMRINFGHTMSCSEFLSDIKSCRGILRAWKRNIEGFIGINKKKLLVVRYEELIGDKEKWVTAFAERLGVQNELSAPIMEEIIKRSSPDVMKKTMPEHVRKCVNGDWKHYFSADHQDLFNEEVGDLLKQLNYSW